MNKNEIYEVADNMLFLVKVLAGLTVIGILAFFGWLMLG